MISAPSHAHPGQLARRYRALADENRLRILEMLADGERCVCELAGDLGLTQPLLSFHLRTLREAGLVRDRRDGRWVHYSLDRDGVAELMHGLDELREPRRRARRCC